MHKVLTIAAVTLIAFATLGATAATIKLTPVTISGGTSPILSMVSGTGVLGGVYWNTAQNAALGFVLNGKTLTTLPKPFEGNVGTAMVPMGFGPQKKVIGYANYLGSYNGLIYETAVGYISDFAAGQIPGTPEMAANSKGTIVLDAPTGSGSYLYYFGTPGPDGTLTSQLTLDPSSYLVSITKAGLMSGSYNPGTPAVFTVTANNTVTSYSVPGSVATYGGFLNNNGQIAGTYKDGSGALHGFIEQAGVYTSFDAPVAVSAMAVQAFSDTSIVKKVSVPAYAAGVYTDQSGAQSAFLYHNGSFVPIPLPAGSTGVTVVGVSTKGHVGLNVVSSAGTTAYVAVCSGSGC